MSIVPLRFTNTAQGIVDGAQSDLCPNPAGRLGLNITPTRSQEMPRAQSPCQRSQSIPPAAQEQPGRLVSVGIGGAGEGEGGGQAAAGQHWLFSLPLVPRHGPRVV